MRPSTCRARVADGSRSELKQESTTSDVWPTTVLNLSYSKTNLLEVEKWLPPVWL